MKTVHIYAEDMREEMSSVAVSVAQDAFQRTVTKGNVNSSIASYITAHFNKSYGSGWNCIVGPNFGSYITHRIKTYLYFTVVPGVYILLWRG